MALRYPDPPLDDGAVALRPWRPGDVPLMDEWLEDGWLARRDDRVLPFAIVDADGTGSDNAASMAVLERLGFEREGLLRSYRPGGEDRVMFGCISPAS